MKLSDFTQIDLTGPQYTELSKIVTPQLGEWMVTGLSGSGKSFLLAALYRKHPRPILIIAPDDESAYTFSSDLKSYTEADILHFPSREILPYEDIEPMSELTAERILAMQKLIEYRDSKDHLPPPILITTIREISEKTIPLETFKNHILNFQFSEDYELDKIALELAEAGYERVPMVEQRGQFAIRGGILDIYNITSHEPVRLEFFGNTLESIRHFRISNQRSKEEIELIKIYPASEFDLMDTCIDEKQPLSFITEYFPAGSIVCFEESLLLHEKQMEFIKLYQERYEQAIDEEKNPPSPAVLSGEFPDILSTTTEQTLIQFSMLENPTPLLKDETLFHKVELHTKSIESYRGAFDKLIDHLRDWQKDSYRVILVCDNDGQKERITELFKEKEIFPEDLSSYQDDSIVEPQSQVYPIFITVGEVANGFLSANLKLAILTDREIFTRYTRIRHFRRFREGVPINDALELRPGDFIVHIDHGIGQFVGLKQLQVDDTLSDFLVLEYKDGDKLYVPVQQIFMVQRYVATDDATPKLTYLGDRSWAKSKAKAKEAIKKMAIDLLQLYSARQVIKGNTFSPDSHWQREFEASFIYDETPDQLTAIQDVKKDMENERPMDRLLCGDVGFGKTEVAIRAAFKAVMDKTQVAVLVPTTLLAEQHWYTFSERLADYPVSVEMISRFRSPKDIKRTLEGVTNGTVDIVIGTHRILSKDLKFRNLGLLIVDEEQRFGVTHKEKLKQMKKEVDVLTLSATPIPRTLYMSLSGIRDMSVINTPPEDRLPIQTYIHRFDKKVIKEAISREINRGGQVYFVHNRVQSIYRMADMIREIVPQARIAVGHGQMQEKELEKIMLDFISRRYDILVSTTIIENGLDIPNCNTIIIDRADAMGLSQLYQLRGRVGRDRHQAYAYLLIPSAAVLKGIAARRLRTIQEFTDLGSGYRIAMRDLEIRGMGNLLGADQSGNMEAIGFDLYCKMVQETINELKGEPIPEPSEVKLDIPMRALLPTDYIPDEKQKFTLYRKFADARTIRDVDAIEEELLDRFGPLPEEAQNLAEMVRVRCMALHKDIIYIKVDTEQVILQWKEKIPGYAMKAFETLKGIQIRVIPPDQMVLKRLQKATKDPIIQAKLLMQKLFSVD